MNTLYFAQSLLFCTISIGALIVIYYSEQNPKK